IEYLRQNVEEFSRPFPSKPDELADCDEVIHVEPLGEESMIVILVYPPQIRTLESEPEEAEPRRRDAVGQMDRCVYFTVQLPASCWFLCMPRRRMTSEVTAFFARSTRLELGTRLCLPALLNVSPDGSVPYNLCSTFRYYGLAPRSATLKEEIRRVERHLLWGRWSWDLERNDIESGFTLFRRRLPARSPLRSFSSWQRATLRGERLWTDEHLFEVTTVYEHLLDLMMCCDRLSTSLPSRIARAARRLLATMGPQDLAREVAS
ncbi:MAG: hypothetical protein HY815_33865, partial [Candidatus Riflebacteria bacterium]|nr:hypothetical protein [Candidatus Riflebacteria bacterium]